MLTIQTFVCAIQFTERLLGGQSLNPQLADAFIAAASPERTGKTEQGQEARRADVLETQRHIQERAAAIRAAREERIQELRRRTDLTPVEVRELDKLEEDDSVEWPQGFARDEHGVYMPSICIRAGLKSALSRQGLFMAERGSKGEQQVGFFVTPNRLRLYTPDLKPWAHTNLADIAVRPISVTTPQGRRSAIVGFESAPAGSIIPFTINSVGMGKLTWDDIEKAMLQLQHDGLWASRSQGYGQFKILAFDGPFEWEETIEGQGGEHQFVELFTGKLVPAIQGKTAGYKPSAHVDITKTVAATTEFKLAARSPRKKSKAAAKREASGDDA